MPNIETISKPEQSQNLVLDLLKIVGIIAIPVIVFSFFDVFLFEPILGNGLENSLFFHVALVSMTLIMVTHINFGGVKSFLRSIANNPKTSVTREVLIYLKYSLPTLLTVMLLDYEEKEALLLSNLMVEQLQSGFFIALEQMQILLLFPAGILLILKKWMRSSLAILLTVLFANLTGLATGTMQLFLLTSLCIGFARGLSIPSLFIAAMILLIFLHPLLVILLVSF